MLGLAYTLAKEESAFLKLDYWLKHGNVTCAVQSLATHYINNMLYWSSLDKPTQQAPTQGGYVTATDRLPTPPNAHE